MPIVEKISVGSRVLANGYLYTITEQVDAYSWLALGIDSSTVGFTFEPGQMEDREFLVID